MNRLKVGIALAALFCVMMASTAAQAGCKEFEGKELTVIGEIDHMRLDPAAAEPFDAWKLYTHAGIGSGCVIVEVRGRIPGASGNAAFPNGCHQHYVFRARGRVTNDVIAAAPETMGYDSAALKGVTDIRCAKR